MTEKSIIIRSGLVSGHQLLKDHRDKADFGNCLVTLEREWNELVERSDEWHDDVIRMLDNVKGFEDRLMELDKGYVFKNHFETLVCKPTRRRNTLTIISQAS